MQCLQWAEEERIITMNSKLKYEKPAAEHICFRLEEELMSTSTGMGGDVIPFNESENSSDGFSFDGSYDSSINGPME